MTGLFARKPGAAGVTCSNCEKRVAILAADLALGARQERRESFLLLFFGLPECFSESGGHDEANPTVATD